MQRVDQPQNLADACRLLIVPSRRLLGQGLQALFTRDGCCGNVSVAVGTEQALARATEFRPNVVLIDLRLPDREALALARSIRVNCPSARLLFLDDSLHTGRLQAALTFGAGYFTQDDSFDALRAAVFQVAAGDWAFTEAARPHIEQTEGRPFFKTPADSPGLQNLTRRQLEILTLLSDGMTVKQCAERLKISPSTVDNHKSRLMARLGAHKVVDLVRVAMQEGLLNQDQPPLERDDEASS